ncbi:MAG TPA: hypothetical protein VGI22_13335, partial [Xanthobacteraceae bacterium]
GRLGNAPADGLALPGLMALGWELDAAWLVPAKADCGTGIHPSGLSVPLAALPTGTQPSMEADAVSGKPGAVSRPGTLREFQFPE